MLSLLRITFELLFALGGDDACRFDPDGLMGETASVGLVPLAAISRIFITVRMTIGANTEWAAAPGTASSVQYTAAAMEAASGRSTACGEKYLNVNDAGQCEYSYTFR